MITYSKCGCDAFHGVVFMSFNRLWTLKARFFCCSLSDFGDWWLVIEQGGNKLIARRKKLNLCKEEPDGMRSLNIFSQDLIQSREKLFLELSAIFGCHHSYLKGFQLLSKVYFVQKLSNAVSKAFLFTWSKDKFQKQNRKQKAKQKNPAWTWHDHRSVLNNFLSLYLRRFETL